MNVLVTGANGFLGAHLVRRLTARGDSVRCLVRGTSDTSPLDGLAYERALGDVTDAASVARAVAGVDLVFHLAGVRRTPRREDFLRVNAEGTRHVLDAAVAAGARARVVLCGSLAACGPSHPTRPHVEEDPLRPTEWYGESKAEAERLTLAYADRLPVSVVRPPRITGPGDRENLAFFKLAQRGVRLSIGGGPRPLTLVDVEDVADMLLVLGEHPAALGQAFFCAGEGGTLTLEGLQDTVGRALNLSMRTVHVAPWALKALAAVADGVSTATGRHLPLNRKLARQLLAPAWTCSGDKAARVLGFRPRRDIVDSLVRSAHWYREKGWL